MKSLILSLFILLFFLSSKANDLQTSEINTFVNQWNQLHNTKDIEDFRRLYAPTVYFYGVYNARYDLLSKIEKYIAKDNSQQIITPITISYYDSGNIKCEFTKRIARSGKIKEYPSYLVIQKKEDGYWIVGESDAVTDTNLNTTIPLYDKINKSESHPVGYLLLSAAIIAGLAIFIRRRQQSKRLQQEEDDNSTYNQSIHIPQPNKLIGDETGITDEERKGIEFEKYIVEKFDRGYFKIKEWRSDKYHKGIYAESNTYPDFEIIYNSKYEKRIFAVECKWRSGFYNNNVKLAKEKQLNNYNQYADEKGQCVYIILGIGGTPANPQKVYIIPLKDIIDTTYSETQLKKYLRNKNGMFFLQPKWMELT